MGAQLNQKKDLWAKSAVVSVLTSFLIIFLSRSFDTEWRDESRRFLHHATRAVEQEPAFNSTQFFDSFELWKRDDALTWDAAQNKGRGLLCLMESTQAEAEIIGAGLFPVTSPFTTYDELDRWGWVRNDDYTGLSYGDSFDSIFAAIGVSSADNAFVRYDQSQERTVDNVQYIPSGGRSANLYNVNGGMIVADENFSPSSMDPRLIGANQGLPYVLLKQSSDLIFLEWQQQCLSAGAPIGGLQYNFQVNVVNKQTEAIIQQVLTTSGSSMGDFPSKTTFYPGSAGFFALLATPNASGVAIMLFQHKAQMGLKTVTSISIFNFLDLEDGEDLIPTLFITIGDYTPPQ